MGLIEASVPSMLASHLNGLLGGFWMLGVSYSLRWCHASEAQLKRMALLIITANYMNWLITLIKALCAVSAITWIKGQTANNLIHVLLIVGVVAPALWGSGMWVVALFRRPPTT
jgi:hydroxylaminobenzene mutase